MENFIKEIKPLINELANHPLYKKLQTREELTAFMERHVYAVFDFMSLAKSLQREFAPAENIWLPPKHSDMARFVNEIILCEESDETPQGQTMSHYNMYALAMREVNASDDLANEFIEKVRHEGIDAALEMQDIPLSARKFMRSTFDIIKRGKIHEIGSSFCFGREKAIPEMFQALIDKMGITNVEAPMFHYYLERHIEVDGDSHGPLALKMIEILCDGDEEKIKEALDTAKESLKARLQFWDDVGSELGLL